MPEVQPDSADTRALLDDVAHGDADALASLLHRHEAELRRFIEIHLNPRLRPRVDPSDVVQETHLVILHQIDDFLTRRPMPFRLWLRKTAQQRLVTLFREHTRAKRSIDREEALPDRSSLLVAAPLLRDLSTPSKIAAAREVSELVSRAVAHLSDADREILLMRHAEELPYEEIACLLDVDAAAARKRYGRALIRLQRALCQEGLLE